MATHIKHQLEVALPCSYVTNDGGHHLHSSATGTKTGTKTGTDLLVRDKRNRDGGHHLNVVGGQALEQRLHALLPHLQRRKKAGERGRGAGGCEHMDC